MTELRSPEQWSQLETLGFAGRDRESDSALFFTLQACAAGLEEPLAVETALEYRMNDQGDAEADRQHEQAHSEPFGEGVLFSVCGAPIGPAWRIRVAVLVAPAGLVGQGGVPIVLSTGQCCFRD